MGLLISATIPGFLAAKDYAPDSCLCAPSSVYIADQGTELEEEFLCIALCIAQQSVEPQSMFCMSYVLNLKDDDV